MIARISQRCKHRRKCFGSVLEKRHAIAGPRAANVQRGIDGKLLLKLIRRVGRIQRHFRRAYTGSERKREHTAAKPNAEAERGRDHVS
jgi:hypothetical protein